MAIITYDKIIKYKIVAVCNGPLHIGSAVGGAESVLVHPVDGSPFIQASGIAGAMRDYYAKSFSEKQASALFGSSLADIDSGSRIVFSDGIFDIQTVKMELRPHISINRSTGSVSNKKGSGQKFDMEYVGAGATFTTDIYLYVDSQLSDMPYEQNVFEMINAMYNQGISFGAKKSSGAGKIKAMQVYCKTFEMHQPGDRALWMKEQDLTADVYDDITSQLVEKQSANVKYRVVVTGKTEGAILIKGIAVDTFGENAPDSQNIKNAQGRYIVPGSSVRGAVRSQMERIATYMGKTSVIDCAYGKVGETQSDGHAGNLMFSDIVINNTGFEDRRRARIHIDKFTGGVFDRGLFQEQNTTGVLENFEIEILNQNEPDVVLGMLVLTLRDLMIKTMSLGSGFATGKGFVDVECVTITDGKNKTVITSDGVTDESGIIANAMKALQEVEA